MSCDLTGTNNSRIKGVFSDKTVPFSTDATVHSRTGAVRKGIFPLPAVGSKMRGPEVQTRIFWIQTRGSELRKRIPDVHTAGLIVPSPTAINPPTAPEAAAFWGSPLPGLHKENCRFPLRHYRNVL